ncbi:MAG: hypothetical protein Greene071421_497 [Parcubacteria group bacterium Greene0714_21]|nr:MAG: hypothetical protein Greene041639_380 [Parcubacteria group bacterium Greene0416_39]TSC97320.1 MAG: hypothetical protein Greene101447_529 [Parcubacteria group bacterium Greene1014_47]TSD03952.1 MAG: hypothetical protein Greene071421_497 [Parcubacteria group bacterium Greene0714_21]
MYEAVLIAGFGGGVIRGLVGFLKHYYSYKEVKFKLPSFLSTMVLSGIVGVTAAFAIKESGIFVFGTDTITPAMALIIGYAGGDFLEGVFKILMKKPA